MDKNRNEVQDDKDLSNLELMTNSVGNLNNKSNLGIDPINKDINKRNDIKSNQDLTLNNPTNLASNQKLPANKNYIEDNINIESKNLNPKNIDNSKNIFDEKIFSDDDMSLNKSIFNNQNSNKNINNAYNSSTNSLLFSLNINEIPFENNNNEINENLKNDIKKIIPNEIFNNLNYSNNQLITNVKEGLKKLFIYLSDSLNNQKKINGSNDYYYNNDLNSENLLKIYIFIKMILNNFKIENNDTINESLFIINLILPLLPTNYIKNICEQLINIFYYKTVFEELRKNIYLLFKQILRLNQNTFFDKIFLLLNNEKNLNIKYFWEKFIYDLIQKSNENYGIGFDINNNEGIINILNEYHKDDLINFCLNLFNYDDLNEISSNKEAYELIECICNNKILSHENKDYDENSFKEGILNKVKDNESLYIIIKNIFEKKINNSIFSLNNEIHRSKNNFENLKDNNSLEDEDFKSGTFFKGSFANLKINKDIYLSKESENLGEINNFKDEKYENKINNNDDKMNKDNKEIFEIMNNNIIYKDNNNLKTKKNKKKKKIFQIDLSEDDENIEDIKNTNQININENNKEKDIKENNINFINNYSNKLSNYSEYNNSIPHTNIHRFSNYNEKYSGDSLINYKYSGSTNNEINLNDEQKEKNSFNDRSTITTNLMNNTKNDETLNNGNTLNNNLFSSFSSFSSFKGTKNYTRAENISNNNINNNELNSNGENNKIINNKNFLNLIKNKIYSNNNIEVNKENNIIDNSNILELMDNNNKINDNKDEKIKNNEKINLIDNNKFMNMINKDINENIIAKNNIENRQNSYKNDSTSKKKLEDKNNSFNYTNCLNLIEKGKWIEKQNQVNLLKKQLDKSLTKQNYSNSNIEIENIINLINKKLKDNQQKLVILILEILEIIINKLEEIFNVEYLPILSKSIINNLNDNNIQLRTKTVGIILKILTYNKKDFFINELIESLKLDKNNMRIELLTILNQYFSKNKNNNSKKANKNFFNLLVDPLVLCIEDKSSRIRNLSEELIKESTNYIMIEKYYESTKKLYGKVGEDKVNYKINEIYCLEKNLNIANNNNNNNSASSIDNANIRKSGRILNLTIKKDNIETLERSKSFDSNKKRNKDNNILKKKNNLNDINSVSYNDNNNNNNNSFAKNIDYKNIFRKNINFLDNKKYRNNKDMKLGKNFITIKEKGKNDLKPLTQIFINDYINNCINPCDKKLNLILNSFNKVIINCDINFKTCFLMNLDIILEFIIRLFDYNINNNNDFINEYIAFIDNIYEKLIIYNLKMTYIENCLILHSLIFLSKYKPDIISSIKKFYKLISIDKVFKILFDYNDLNDIEIQKNILDLFKNEFLQGNIDITNDNFSIAKKINKFFYNEKLVSYTKNIFKEIYGIVGDKIIEEFINKLNKQDKNIFLNNVDFNIKNNIIKENLIEKNEEKNITAKNGDLKFNNNPKIIKKKIIKNNAIIYKNKENFIKEKNNINNNKLMEDNLLNQIEKNLINDFNNKKILENTINNNNKLDSPNKIIKQKEEVQSNDNNSLKENNDNKIDVTNINEILELINDLSLNNNEIEKIDEINNNIIINKLKLISIFKDLFKNSSNFDNNKKILMESIELILDSLSTELNIFYNINTMNSQCPQNIISYIREIISVFYIISTKSEIIQIIKENILNKLLILFLNYLEIDKEEKISDINNDFNDIFQKINKITLNIIQKSNREEIIIVLMKLISNFKEESNIALLGINCLVKLIKITDFKKIDSVKILTEIIITIQDEELFLGINNNKANELFLKSIKKLLNQLVMKRKYNILKDYQMAINNCNLQDEKVCEWIQKILEHNKY